MIQNAIMDLSELHNEIHEMPGTCHIADMCCFVQEVGQRHVASKGAIHDPLTGTQFAVHVDLDLVKVVSKK